MKLIITRPVVVTGDGGTRSFAPGLTVEVDAAAKALTRTAFDARSATLA